MPGLPHDDALLDPGYRGRRDKSSTETVAAELRRVQPYRSHRVLHGARHAQRAHRLHADVVVAVNTAKERATVKRCGCQLSAQHGCSHELTGR